MLLSDAQRQLICHLPIVCAAASHNGLFCGVIRLVSADPADEPILMRPNVYTTRAIAEDSMRVLVASIRRADGSSN